MIGSLRTRNVVLMMVDGLRWQEVFRGAEPALLDTVPDEGTRTTFGGATPAARRAALLPFLWSTVAGRGTLLGDRDLGSSCAVTNGSRVSYPGYSETLCGYADPAVTGNDHGPNPNPTVFHRLARHPDRRGDMAAFAAWDGIGDVFDAPRAPFPVAVGYEPVSRGRITGELHLLNRLKAETPRGWPDEAYDAVTMHSALQWIVANGPRLVFVGLGEPDEWAHRGDYGRYLDSTNRWDAAVGELWSTLQLMPQYRDSTTLILATDHGRGQGERWTDHGADTPGSDATWMAFLGPDTPAAGSVDQGRVTNGGVAATIARLLGVDLIAAEPRAAAPIDAAFREPLRR